MREVYVSLPTVERVQQFVGVLTGLPGDFDLLAGRHILDARSLMGIFSLDLTKPQLLKVYDDNKNTMAALGAFISPQEEAKI